jgi:hypothetical protein
VVDDQAIGEHAEAEPGWATRLYDYVGGYAGGVRTGLQMVIGGVLVLRVGWFAVQHFWADAEVPVTARAILSIAGTYLAASTAVELAYFLFTPGPDEAYRPVLLALAAVALLLGGAVTSDGTSWAAVGGLVAVVVLLVGMLVLKPRIEEILERGEVVEHRRDGERARRRREARRRPTVLTIKPPVATKKSTVVRQ